MDKHGSIFITATDTGVGKTLVCGLLLRFMLEKSINAGYQKWASTGDGENPPDLDTCCKIAGQAPDPEIIDCQVPCRFQFAASPHLAAELEGREIDPEVIIAAYRKMAGKYAPLIVEGVGGLLVPLRRDLLLVDLLARLRIPTIIVARSGLGTINHTLLTIEALRSRDIPVFGVIFSDSAEEDETIATDNFRTIADIGKVEILGRLPRLDNLHELSRAFNPIGERIFKLLS